MAIIKKCEELELSDEVAERSMAEVDGMSDKESASAIELLEKMVFKI